jgi:hypothetical protein
LLDLGEIRRVEHQFAFLLGRCDQFGRTELLRLRRCTPQEAEAGDAGQRHFGEDPSVHSQSSL